MTTDAFDLWTDTTTELPVSLTTYRAPLGTDPPGSFGSSLDVPDHVVYIEPTHRWIRGDLDGRVVVDTRDALLVFETDRFPTYYFPREHIAPDTLVDGGARSGTDALGRRHYHHVRTATGLVEKGAWSYPSPAGMAGRLAGHVAFRWDALERWREEEDELIAHARDPYHRVDALPSSRHVVVRLDGQVLADSTNAVLLFESGLPTRYYLPLDDVVTEVLFPSDTVTGCPYKGWARYHHVTVDGTTHEDLMWSYDDPFHEVAPIAGMRCFYNEKVEIEVDGVTESPPVTKWS